MNWQVKVLTQLGHKCRSGIWAQQTSHILNSQYVCTGLDDFFRQVQVVIQRVELLVRIAQVTGVRHGNFGDGSVSLQHRFDGWAHLGDIVKRIENAENVNARLRCFLHKRTAHAVWVWRVAYRVAATQQHLDIHVWHGLTQKVETLPWILEEETHGDVVGRAAPGFNGVQLWGQTRDVLSCGHQRGTTHTRC